MAQYLYNVLFPFGTKCKWYRQIFSENLSSLWGLNGRGSSLSSLSELFALPGKACLPCLTPESDKVLVDLANSCRDAWLCLMRVWEILCTILHRIQSCMQYCTGFNLVQYCAGFNLVQYCTGFNLVQYCFVLILKFFQEVFLSSPKDNIYTKMERFELTYL